MKQECDWMKSQHVPLSMNDEEIVETQSSDESFTESHTAEVSQLPCQPSGQKLTIDNIDFRQQVHYMTQEHQVIDQHYLTICATNNRVHCNHLSSLYPVDKLRATVCKNQTKSEICGKVQIFYCALILDLS